MVCPLLRKGSRDANAADQAGGIDISLSIGSSNSSSESTQTSSTAVCSVVSAGKNLTINATAGDLTAIGSALTAGNDASLSATGNINLLAAKNTITQQSTNDSGSASIGIGFKLGGQQNGFTLNFGASSGQGKDKGNDLSWTNTTVSAGNKATLKSGQDTNLIGATVSANQVVADVGGNLNIVSLQDMELNSRQTKAVMLMRSPIAHCLTQGFAMHAKRQLAKRACRRMSGDMSRVARFFGGGLVIASISSRKIAISTILPTNGGKVRSREP